jgi:hypothetical protein
MIYMPTASELANGWDRLRKENDRAVDGVCDRIIAKHPGSWWAVATIRTLSYDFPVTLGAGFVDVLRLGEGSHEGGWGIGKDALRLVTVVGPFGRMLGIVRARSAAAGVANGTGPNCTWITTVKALRQTAVRHTATLKDLCRVANIRECNTAGAWVSGMVPLLQKLGAVVRPLREFTGAAGESLKDIAALARRNTDGVVMFSVKWSNKAFAAVKNPNGNVGHSLLAYRDPIRGVIFADRSGRVVGALQELESLYPGIGSAVPFGSTAFVQNARILTGLRAAGVFSVLALDVIQLDSRAE